MANSNNQLVKEIRFDWNKEEILEIFNMPLIDLMLESQIVHFSLRRILRILKGFIW